MHTAVLKAPFIDPTGTAVLNLVANSQQQVTLALTGTYLIQVQSSDLVTTGTYILFVECRQPLRSTLFPYTTLFRSGKITASAQVDQYTYAAQAGGIVTLTLADTGG